MKKGVELNQEDQRCVLAAYIYRNTGDHVPPTVPRGILQFKNDQEWLEHTSFKVTKVGRLDHRAKYCYSSPTWPNNPELRRG